MSEVVERAKFSDPQWTAKGERRAAVTLRRLDTLWLNTGTLCNITCRNCYIESSPRNDRLAYLTLADATAFLDEIAAERLGTRSIGFTGGEPFLNPDVMAMLTEVLARGHEALVLTNAMLPMMRHLAPLAALAARHGAALRLRVSLDHYTEQVHEAERGPRSFAQTLKGLRALAERGIAIAVAGRRLTAEGEAEARQGFARLFAAEGLPLNAASPSDLVIFPEMDGSPDVPEITERCWGLLGRSPDDVMCASQRMVVRRKGDDHAVVLACTLLPYDQAFELGRSLKEAFRPVLLNHPHCAKFCVLGGSSCSGR